MKNARNVSNEKLTRISKYIAGTPFYCKNFFYWLFVVVGTLIDWVAVYALYDAALNGNMVVALITSFGIVIVLDLYSQWLPAVLEYMPKKKQVVIFGIALAGIVALVAALSVAFRISTGDVSTSNTEVELSSNSTVLINVILGSIPIASTLAMLFLSIQKAHWDKRNAVYINEQLLIPLRTRAKEVELSLGKVIDLAKLDYEEYLATIELMKAKAITAKCDARNEFATALGDSESAKALSERVLPAHIIDSLIPAPIEEDDVCHKRTEEE